MSKNKSPKKDYSSALHTIATKRRGKPEMTLAAVRSLFLCSDDSIEEFASKYLIPKASLEKHIYEGGWLELREENRQKSTQILDELVKNQTHAALEAELMLQALRLSQMQDHLEYLARYKAQYGDLFLRDQDTGELLFDHNNMPMSLQLPTSTAQLSERKAQLELVQILNTLRKQDEQEAPKPVGSGSGAASKNLPKSKASEILELAEKNGSN